MPGGNPLHGLDPLTESNLQHEQEERLLGQRAIESFFSALKTERTARRRYAGRDKARAGVFDYIERLYCLLRLVTGHSKRRFTVCGNARSWPVSDRQPKGSSRPVAVYRAPPKRTFADSAERPSGRSTHAGRTGECVVRRMVGAPLESYRWRRDG